MPQLYRYVDAYKSQSIWWDDQPTRGMFSFEDTFIPVRLGLVTVVDTEGLQWF